MDIIQVITRELNVEKWQVEAAVKLIDEVCTIPLYTASDIYQRSICAITSFRALALA